MGLREAWGRMTGKVEIIERPKDWSQFEYHNSIWPNCDPHSPAGSFYMDRYLTSTDRKGRAKVFGVCREGQSADGHFVDVYSIAFDRSTYSETLLEEDYPHLLWSLLEEYAKSKYYSHIHFPGANNLNVTLLKALGAEEKYGMMVLANDDNWKSRKDAFLAAYTEMREQAKNQGKGIVGVSEGIAVIVKSS